MRYLLLLALFLTNTQAKQPNIVFILADDLGWSDTELYGTTSLYQTPNLKRLAERGLTFTRAYAASPLCSPTRSSILTGQNPARTGITAPNCHLGKVTLEATPATRGNPGFKAVPPNSPTRFKTDHYTLAEALKDNGYATGHFGKWHLGLEPYSPLEHGFDIDIPHWHGPGPAGNFVAPWKYPDFDPQTPNEHIEDRMAQEAAKFIARNKADEKPFFLNYWMFSVHAPFDAKRSLIEKYRKIIDPKDPQRSPTYAAMVESMDDAVGTLMDTLDQHGLTDDTILIFFSDNGGNMYNEVDNTTPTSNTPLRGGKATMFEGGIRVPCIISWPGKTKPATRTDAIIQSDDFYPSLLEMLNLKPKDNQIFDGKSFVPALEGKPHNRGPIFTYFPHNPPVPDWVPPSASVIQGDDKLIRLFYQGDNGAHRYKLYNLKEDIGEKQNLADAQPEKLKQLDALIEKFLTETKAVLPGKNTAFDPSKYQPEQEGVPKIRNKPAAKTKDDKPDPKLKGWRARHCKATVKDGIVTIHGPKTPYLGVAASTTGPATIKFKVRSQKGGSGKIEWLKADVPAKSIPFTLKASTDWQEKAIQIPTDKPLGILRIYLPASQPIEIDWIQLKEKRWDF